MHKTRPTSRTRSRNCLRARKGDRYCSTTVVHATQVYDTAGRLIQNELGTYTYDSAGRIDKWGQMKSH
jgi:hypothetical protein